jgi:single-strand DNA-binding protein
MASFNKILLMGNLTRDPELSYLPSQTAVVEFGLAVNRRYKGKDGQNKEDTCFIDCRAYGRQAENINKYLSKGRPVFVDGRLDFDTWTSQDGSRRSKHRVTVTNLQFLPGGGSGGGAGGGGSQGQRRGQSQSPGQQGGYDESMSGGVDEDDIPF